MVISKNAIILVGAIAIAAALFLGLWIYSKAESGVIMACANKHGTIYLVGDGFTRSKCAKNDLPVSWNMEGPKGDKGNPGPQGPPGVSAPMPPETVRPVVSNYQICYRSNRRVIELIWRLQNDLDGFSPITSGNSWGTLTLFPDDVNSRRVVTANGFATTLEFNVSNPSPPSTENPIPFELKLSILVDGFIIDFPLANGVIPDIIHGNCLLG